MPKVQIKRGTRAQLDAAATAFELFIGEHYLITDEDRIAVGLSTSTYETFAKESEAGSGGNQFSQLDFEAAADPTTPAADVMTMYLVASGTTPNREVALMVKDEAGQTVILSTVLV